MNTLNYALMGQTKHGLKELQRNPFDLAGSKT